MYDNVCVYVHMCMCMCMCVYACKSIYACIRVCAHVYARVYVHVCVCMQEMSLLLRSGWLIILLIITYIYYKNTSVISVTGKKI